MSALLEIDNDFDPRSEPPPPASEKVVMDALGFKVEKAEIDDAPPDLSTTRDRADPLDAALSGLGRHYTEPQSPKATTKSGIPPSPQTPGGHSSLLRGMMKKSIEGEAQFAQAQAQSQRVGVASPRLQGARTAFLKDKDRLQALLDTCPNLEDLVDRQIATSDTSNPVIRAGQESLKDRAPHFVEAAHKLRDFELTKGRRSSLQERGIIPSGCASPKLQPARHELDKKLRRGLFQRALRFVHADDEKEVPKQVKKYVFKMCDIWKRLSFEPNPPKRKHAKALLELMEKEESAVPAFFKYVKKFPHQTNSLVWMKTLVTVHIVLQSGPFRVLSHGYENVQFLEELSTVWKLEAEKGTPHFDYPDEAHIPHFAAMVAEYASVLADKLRFHHRFPEFDGLYMLEKYNKDLRDIGASDQELKRLEVHYEREHVMEMMRLQQRLSVLYKAFPKEFERRSHTDDFINDRMGYLIPILYESFCLFVATTAAMRQIIKAGKLDQFSPDIRRKLLGDYYAQYEILQAIHKFVMRLDNIRKYYIPELPQPGHVYIRPVTTDGEVEVEDITAVPILIRQSSFRLEKHDHDDKSDTE